MRKHHQRVGIGLALLLLVCALPTRAGAKPEATPHKATPRPSAAEPRPETGDPSKERSAPRAKTRVKKRELPPCYAKGVQLVRQLGSETEARSLALTYCDGKPNPAALEALSVLARSRHVARPEPSELRAYQRLPLEVRVSTREPDFAKTPRRKRDPAYVVENVMRLHEGLVERLQKVVDHFPGKTLEVVSGHRPEARQSSRHHHGRALDFRVQGVTRERLRDFLRSFEATGVGYYPNSSFVHMDVREDKGYWVDRSGPGEAADYGTWPPPKREIEDAQARILQGALADLAELGTPSPTGERPRDVLSAPPLARMERARVMARPILRAAAEPAESGDSLTPAEVAHIRQEALKALEALR